MTGQPRKRRRALPAAIITAFLAAMLACGAPETGELRGYGFSVRDSAGIEVVENVGDPTTLTEWTLPAVPELRIGTLDGPPEFQFFRVMSTVRLDDGSVVVANGGSSDIRVFWPDGSLRAAFGGEGEGPEEFRFPWRVWSVTADSLLVYDWRNLRFARWTADGDFVDVRPISAKFQNQPFPGGRFGDGSILFVDQTFEIPDRGFKRAPMILHRYADSGAPMDTVASVPGMKLGQMEVGRGGFVGAPHFAGSASAAALADGVVVCLGTDYEFQVLDLDGQLVRLIRWSGRDRTVTDQHVAKALEDQLARTETEEQRQQATDFFESTPAEEEFGTILNLMPGVDDGVWAREYPRPDDPDGARWLVFGGDGRLMGRLVLPAETSLSSIGRDHVVVVERDDLDVEYVSVYSLPWESTESG